MAFSKRLLRLSFHSLKLLLGALLGLVWAGTPLPAHAAIEVTQDALSKLINDIRNAAEGRVKTDNIAASLTAALADNPETSPDMLAIALNRAGLDIDTLSRGITSGAARFEVDPSVLVSALLTDTYINRGQNGAAAQMDKLRKALGEDVVERALNREDLTALYLSDIETTAGEESDVYNG